MRVSMELTWCQLSAKKFSRQAKQSYKFELLVVKKLTVKFFFGSHNEKIWTVRLKFAKILTVSRKSHHPIENIFNEVNIIDLEKSYQSIQ